MRSLKGSAYSTATSAVLRAETLNGEQRSPFANTDVCSEAGLTIPDGAARPMFNEDLWNFTDVVGLPVQMPLAKRRFDFTAIADPRWRLVAKELILALLAPRRPAVAPLPGAYRTPLHLSSCVLRLNELTRLFGWLEQGGVTTLTALDVPTCQAYLQFRRYITSVEAPSSASRAMRSDASQHRSSSTWSTTGTCSPQTGSAPTCDRGAGPRLPLSPKCRPAE